VLYDSDLMTLACFQGSLEALKWLRSQGMLVQFEYLDHSLTAAMQGHINVLDWLRSKGYEFDSGACQGAAEGGQLETLKWLRNLDPPCPWNEAAPETAIERGHLEVLKWLKRSGCPWPWDAVSTAARCGQIEILEWLRSEGERFTGAACCNAAGSAIGNRRLKTLKWLRSLDPPCPWNKSECRDAAPEWDEALLRWIDQQP